MKNHVKWVTIMIILSIIVACEGYSKKQPFLKTEVTLADDAEKDIAENNVTVINSATNKEDSPNNDRSTISAELSCQQSLEKLGQFSVNDGNVDYKSGSRIFPLLHFIMTKKSIKDNQTKQSVFMKDNPIFITSNEHYKNSLLFALIHTKRTGILNGVVGFPNNEVTTYYKPMLFSTDISSPQIPATETSTGNKYVAVNRKTWNKELSEDTKSCNDALALPPTITKSAFFEYNGAIRPFSKEIDFIAGAEGVGYGLKEWGNRYYHDEKINTNTYSTLLP